MIPKLILMFTRNDMTVVDAIYYPSIWKIINKRIKYFPFCGKVYNRPSVLDGTINEVVQDIKRLESEGVDGFDLLAYRYKDVSMIDTLMEKVKNAAKKPIVSAGSINSLERVEKTIEQQVWGFTIGGAFFEKKFVPGGSFRENVIKVLEKLGKKV